MTKAQKKVVKLERALDMVNRKLNAIQKIQDKAYRAWENAWWSLTEKERDGLRILKQRMGD